MIFNWLFGEFVKTNIEVFTKLYFNTENTQEKFQVEVDAT